MTTRQTPDAVREAAIEFLAKAAESAGCVEVPKGLRGGDIALVSSEIAISAILAALDSRAGDAFAMPEYAPDDISHLEGLASYIDGVHAAARLAVMADYGRIDAAYGDFSHPAATMIDDVRKLLAALSHGEGR